MPTLVVGMSEADEAVAWMVLVNMATTSVAMAPGILMAVFYADPPDPRIEGADYKALERKAIELGTSTRSLQEYQIIEAVVTVHGDFRIRE